MNGSVSGLEDTDAVDGEAVFGGTRLAGDEVCRVDRLVDTDDRLTFVEVEDDNVASVIALAAEGDDVLLVIGVVLDPLEVAVRTESRMLLFEVDQLVVVISDLVAGVIPRE